MFLRIVFTIVLLATFLSGADARAMSVQAGRDSESATTRGQKGEDRIPAYTLKGEDREERPKAAALLRDRSSRDDRDEVKESLLRRAAGLHRHDKEFRRIHELVRGHRNCKSCIQQPVDPPSSVPLPAALPLFGGALLGLVGLRRRSLS